MTLLSNHGVYYRTSAYGGLRPEGYNQNWLKISRLSNRPTICVIFVGGANRAATNCKMLKITTQCLTAEPMGEG